MGLVETKSAIAAAGKAFASWSKTTAKVGSLIILLTILTGALHDSTVMTF